MNALRWIVLSASLVTTGLLAWMSCQVFLVRADELPLSAVDVDLDEFVSPKLRRERIDVAKIAGTLTLREPMKVAPKRIEPPALPLVSPDVNLLSVLEFQPPNCTTCEVWAWIQLATRTRSIRSPRRPRNRVARQRREPSPNVAGAIRRIVVGDRIELGGRPLSIESIDVVEMRVNARWLDTAEPLAILPVTDTRQHSR